MSFLDGLTNRMGIAGELLQFFLNHKWWWLTPMILVLLIFGLLIVFAQSSLSLHLFILCFNRRRMGFFILTLLTNIRSFNQVSTNSPVVDLSLLFILHSCNPSV